MKKMRKSVISLLLGGLLLTACGTSGNVPYTEAQHYFVRNDVKEPPMGKIESQEQLERSFGMAPVMGPGGLPTEIDFSREYVIAVSTAPTSRATELKVESLRREGNDRVVLRYRVEQGEERSYTIQPCLLLVVEGSKADRVELQRVE